VTRARGYSLIELVVVLVAAGILAAIAMPQFNQNEVNASWFYEQVKGGLRYAQRQAVAHRRTVWVFVAANSVELCYTATNPCPPPDGVPDFATASPYKLTAPAGVTLSLLAFSFNALGQPSAGAPFVVGTARVEPETGYVY
jgi:MSHA pilin protein MshC